MALENATYINQLDDASPDGLDRISQGDDHLRLIKRVLQRTFPNIAGEVKISHDQLNSLALPGRIIEPGMIMMWGFGKETIPAGWLLCDGITKLSDGRLSPDLRSKFVIGAGTLVAGTTGGSEKHKHNVTVTVAPQALTIAQIPPHTHQDGFAGYMQGVTGGGGMIPVGTRYPTGSTGGGESHDHPGSTGVSSEVDGRPPFYALCYIIKE
ncbi:tail fiber protein [Pseudomonas phage BroderSalsa]|nr:tail fiber protein [Pseudomonas phage BroderSalsa]